MNSNSGPESSIITVKREIHSNRHQKLIGTKKQNPKKFAGIFCEATLILKK
jgi:hypothetical protein